MNIQQLCVVIMTIIKITHGYNILFLVPLPGPSHWLFFRHFIKELLHRGHTVTAVTNFKLNENYSNYTELLIEPPIDLSKTLKQNEIFDQAYLNDFQYITKMQEIGIISAEYGFECEKVKHLITSDDLHFDLVISEQFFQDSWLMFAYKYGSPIVTIGTYGHSDFFDRFMGLQTPWSHVPHWLSHYGDNMTFFQRFYNTVLCLYDAYTRYFHYYPIQNLQAQKYFGSLNGNGTLPSVQELEKSISAVLVNTHRSVATPRPSMPGIIDIGGAHIMPPKDLPTDIKRYLDDANDGVIYFSFGAFAQGSNMPKEKLRIFLDSFKTIKQRVLWKWEADNLPDLSPNVIVRKWMPQSDILAHKNVILFISHGGLFGTMESVHRGVPMLIMPLFGDQYRNAMKAKAAGYAIVLEFKKLTKQSLTAALSELTYNKNYYNRAKEISTISRDNPISPMDESMFWIEYVIRHNGAKHLKSSAVDLPLISYLLIDIFGVIFTGLLCVVLIFYKVSIAVLREYRNKIKKVAETKSKVKKQ